MAQLPWQAKFGAKLLLSRLPVRYRWWQRLGVFRHTKLAGPDYPWLVFTQHYGDAGLATREPGWVGLELGPGDWLSGAFLARAHGAARTYEVDVADMANRDIAHSQALADHATEHGRPLPPLPPDWDTAFAQVGGEYLTAGLESLRALPAASVDYIWSHSVLEHVWRDQFDDHLRECRRLLRPGGVCSHGVDLEDHLGGSLHSLRFSASFWESAWVRTSGFYTNRIRYREMLDRFEQAGFAWSISHLVRWEGLPLDARALRPEFTARADEDLLVRHFRVVLRPVA